VSGFIGDFVAIAVDVVHSGKDLRCFKHHFYNVFVAVHLCSDWGRLVKYKNVHVGFSCLKSCYERNYASIFTKSKQFFKNIFIFFVSPCFL